jgi:hypothetical protein
MMQIDDLWQSADSTEWDHALERYWRFVLPRNLALERSLDALNVERLRRFDAQAWYEFLRDECFRWKYTAPNRYATTTRQLKRYLDEDRLGDLDEIRRRLLALNTDGIRSGLMSIGVELGPRIGTEKGPLFCRFSRLA